MAPARRQTTTTKTGKKTRLRQGLEGLSSREAQVMRMRHGLTVDDAEPVGQPASTCSPETIQKLREIEAKVLASLGPDQAASGNPTKARIIRTLKKDGKKT